MNIHFCSFLGLDQSLGKAGSGRDGPKNFEFFDISFPFQQYMTWPYLMNTYFWSFKGLGAILGQGRA